MIISKIMEVKLEIIGMQEKKPYYYYYYLKISLTHGHYIYTSII